MSTMTCDVCRGPVTYGQLHRGYDSLGGAGKLKAPRRGWRHWICNRNLIDRLNAVSGPWRTAR